MPLSEDRLMHMLKCALKSDPYYMKVILQDILADLEPPEPTLEERVASLEKFIDTHTFSWRAK